MNTAERIYAEEKYVLEVLELVNGEDNRIELFKTHNIIPVINIACIKENDDVLIASSCVDEITLAASYLYTPSNLISSKIEVNKSDIEWIENAIAKWREVEIFLNGYTYTRPSFNYIDIENIQLEYKAFDVIIAGYFNLSENILEKSLFRFALETGLEYEVYENILKNTSNILKEDGRLIILCKPAWVLKSWELLENLKLQLEYKEYNFYTENMNHPNTFIWLRFAKNMQNFDMNKQKTNIGALMKDNNIDRLYAHRNDLRFPYVELSYKNSESYVNLEQNLEYMQYFFSMQTTEKLATLCKGYTACLVTPSIALNAYKSSKNVVLFERDNRFREKRGVKFVKYDLCTGLTKFTRSQYANKFDTVICDPPFDINLDILARDIYELAKSSKSCDIYVVFPEHRKISLINSMKNRGFVLSQDKINIDIEYGRPPKLVRLYGKQAIQLFKFR